MNQPTTKTLTQGQLIRLASWRNSYTSVGFVSGNEATRAIAAGHDVAYAIYTGSVLSDSPAYYAAARSQYESATIVEDGEIVTVDGITYRLHVVPGNGGQWPRNCDPIHFKRER